MVVIRSQRISMTNPLCHDTKQFLFKKKESSDVMLIPQKDPLNLLTFPLPGKAFATSRIGKGINRSNYLLALTAFMICHFALGGNEYRFAIIVNIQCHEWDESGG